MAISSHTLIPHEEMRDSAIIVQTVKSMEFDGVIITRVADVRARQKDYYKIDMYNYYNSSFAYSTVYTTSQQKFSFESNLYDAATEKLVFSLSSDTYAQNNIKKRINSYIKIVVNKLVQNNLL